jgi:hypothetical protein
VAGIPAVFSVSADAFPVYAGLYKAGVLQGSRVTVSSAGNINLTPTSIGSFTARLYSALTGGFMLFETPSFTVTVEGTITGPSVIPATAGNPSDFEVEATAYPVYAILRTGGSDVGARVLVASNTVVQLTPASTAAHTARLYGSVGGPDLLDETASFTPITCTYGVDPTSITAVPAAGATGLITVTASNGVCPWTAVSSNPGVGGGWLDVTAGSSGSGDGTVSYLAYANYTLLSRTATITVAGQVVTVQQDAETGGGTTGYRYYGVSPDIGPLDSSEIVALANSDVSDTNDLIISLDPAEQYIYYAYPAFMGALGAIYLNGDTSINQIGAFTELTPVDVIPEGIGDPLSYRVYRSEFPLDGTIIFSFA